MIVTDWTGIKPTIDWTEIRPLEKWDHHPLFPFDPVSICHVDPIGGLVIRNDKGYEKMVIAKKYQRIVLEDTKAAVPRASYVLWDDNDGVVLERYPDYNVVVTLPVLEPRDAPPLSVAATCSTCDFGEAAFSGSVYCKRYDRYTDRYSVCESYEKPAQDEAG
jgi:hypothetical protein